MCGVCVCDDVNVDECDGDAMILCDDVMRCVNCVVCG